MYKCMHYKDTCSSSSWGQKSTCDSVLLRFPILIHVQFHRKYSITNNLYKTGALLIMMFISPLVLARRHNSSIHQLDT